MRARTMLAAAAFAAAVDALSSSSPTRWRPRLAERDRTLASRTTRPSRRPAKRTPSAGQRCETVSRKRSSHGKNVPRDELGRGRAARERTDSSRYLEPGAAPLKDSQCVVRFVNVPASALDASARPSADCFEIWRRGGDVVIVLSRPRGRANGSGADRGAAAGRNVDISRADRTRGAIELRRMVRADGLRAALDDAASPRVPDNAPPPFRRPSL